ncbi:MAG TPA: hypothetical protein VJ938_13195, partial [Acidimicrobiia bacterium]|nr:hypothetical protein [Acidimicrobiia bacterium]
PHVWDGDAVVDFAGFMPTAMFVNQYLPFWAQYTRTITQWSPDSTGFAYAAAPDDGPGQVRFQPLDGEIVDMGEGEMVIWSP